MEVGRRMRYGRGWPELAGLRAGQAGPGGAGVGSAVAWGLAGVARTGGKACCRRGGVAGAEPPHKGGPNRPDRPELQ